MRFKEITEGVQTSGIFYHGTNAKFDTFDVAAEKVNRATNVSGAYFTPSAVEADEYGSRVLKVEVTTKRPFYAMQKNEVTEEMAAKAKELLSKYTSYKEHWLETAIIPAFIEKGNFNGLSDVSGDIKREILLAGGYDAYVDGRHVVVLEPTSENVEILKEL